MLLRKYIIIIIWTRPLILVCQLCGYIVSIVISYYFGLLALCLYSLYSHIIYSIPSDDIFLSTSNIKKHKMCFKSSNMLSYALFRLLLRCKIKINRLLRLMEERNCN